MLSLSTNNLRLRTAAPSSSLPFQPAPSVTGCRPAADSLDFDHDRIVPPPWSEGALRGADGAAGRAGAGKVAKLRDILPALDLSRRPEGMDLPGFRLHALNGRLIGHCAVSVSGNWRVAFRYEYGAAADLDFVEYR